MEKIETNKINRKGEENGGEHETAGFTGD
jgi:hypothetical protein